MMSLRTLRILFWTAALFTLVMALLPHPPRIPGEPSDKIQHIAAFITLAGLAGFGYPDRKLKAALGLVAFGAAIELLQMIPALHRDAQLGDWIADTIAALTVLAILAIARKPVRT